MKATIFYRDGSEVQSSNDVVEIDGVYSVELTADELNRDFQIKGPYFFGVRFPEMP